MLQPALGAFEPFEIGKDGCGLAAGADRKARRDKRILDLEFADQRQSDRMPGPAMFEREFLRKAVDIGRDQANALAGAVALAADRDDPKLAHTRRIDHGLRDIMIGRDHRRATGHDQIAKQPQLGGQVMRDVGMVIHVVARQIGESAGLDPDNRPAGTG